VYSSLTDINFDVPDPDMARVTAVQLVKFKEGIRVYYTKTKLNM